LVKPNHHELGELFDVTIQTREDAVTYAKRLREQGAENVLVSMASKGAVLVTKDAVYTADAPKGTVVNSVGAGDSMVAGFLCGFLEEGCYENALRMGIAAGSASAFREDLASKEDVEMLFHNVYIKESKNGGLYKNV
jgi:1-phosphofructokinase